MVFDKLKSIFGGGEEKKEEVSEEVGVKKESLSIDELKKRINKRRNQPLQEIEEDYESILERVSNVRGKILDVNQSLLDAEAEEEVHPNIYKSASEAKRLFSNKVDRALEKMEPPSEPTWNGLLSFNRSLRDGVNLLQNARISHGNQVATLYEKEISKLNRLTNSAQSLSEELNSTLVNAKNKVDDFDELLEYLSEREEMLKAKKEFRKEIERLKNREQELEDKQEKKKKSLESLKKSNRFKELEDLKEEKKKLIEKKDKISKKIEYTISEISRPLRKMSKMIERDEHMVSKEVLDAIDSYRDNPVQTALQEVEELPKLRALLQELEEVLEDKMKLDEKERKKRLEEVRGMMKKEKVRKLRSNYLEIEDKLNDLKKEIETSPLLEKKENLEKSIQENESEIDSVREKIEQIEEDLDEKEISIEENARKIREKAESILNVEIEEL